VNLASLKPHLRMAPFGLVLGFTLSQLGFSNFGEVNRMLTLTGFRLTLAFMMAVAIAMAGFFLLDRG
jgi:hypothetical protein